MPSDPSTARKGSKVHPIAASERPLDELNGPVRSGGSRPSSRGFQSDATLPCTPMLPSGSHVSPPRSPMQESPDSIWGDEGPSLMVSSRPSTGRADQGGGVRPSSSRAAAELDVEKRPNSRLGWTDPEPPGVVAASTSEVTRDEGVSADSSRGNSQRMPALMSSDSMQLLPDGGAAVTHRTPKVDPPTRTASLRNHLQNIVSQLESLSFRNGGESANDGEERRGADGGSKKGKSCLKQVGEEDHMETKLRSYSTAKLLSKRLELRPAELESVKTLRKNHKLVQSTIMYEANSPLRMLFRLKGTMIKRMITSVDFYLVMLAHLFFTTLYWKIYGQTEADKTLPKVKTEIITMSGTLVVFLLVFYNSQAYTRFFNQYMLVRKFEGRVRIITILLAGQFREGRFPGAYEAGQDLFRVTTAAHYLGFVNIPDYKSQGINGWACNHLQLLKILSAEEIEYLQNLGGAKPVTECVLWCTQKLLLHMEQGHIDSITYNKFVSHYYGLRSCIGDIYDIINQPIPFAYFHLLNTLLLFYLLILSYAFVFFGAWISFVGFTLACLALLGLRELNCALADPFGIDDTDLPVFDSVMSAHSYHEELMERVSVFGPHLRQVH